MFKVEKITYNTRLILKLLIFVCFKEIINKLIQIIEGFSWRILIIKVFIIKNKNHE